MFWFDCAEAISAQELAMPMPMQMPTWQMLLLPTGGHTLNSDHATGDLDQGGSKTPVAKEPMVFSMLKGNTVVAADLAEEELCRGFSGSSVAKEKKCIALLDLNEDKNYC